MITSMQQEIMSLTEQVGGTWGIVVENLYTGECFSHNPDLRFYAASLIKIPIMTAVFADVYAGRFAFEDTIPLRQEDLVGGAGVLQHMQPRLPLTIHDLVTLMIIQSDNTATNILIDLVGVESIRMAMKQTGMEHSHFYNKLMVIPAEVAGYNEVTAADMASHLRYLASGKIISYNSCLQMIHILKRQQFRDALGLYLPDPDHDVIGGMPKWELANKTGTVTDIEHDTGILYVGQEAILISLLSKNATSANVAKETMGRIGKLIYETYSGV